MRIEGLIRNFNAGAEVLPYRIVKFGDSDNEAVPAVDGTMASIGVSDQMGAAAAGDPLDVIRSGIAEVEFGGNVTRGDWLTATAGGKAIATTTAGDQVIGRAEVSGVDGDIGSVHIALGTFAAAV